MYTKDIKNIINALYFSIRKLNEHFALTYYRMSFSSSVKHGVVMNLMNVRNYIRIASDMVRST
jgi:hypothetical protein